MALESGRLLHLGNVVVDIVLNIPALPERGGDVLATGSDTTTGGGFNVMVAAARQDTVVYAGAHGTGPFGDGPEPPCSAPGSRFRSGRRPISTPASSSASSTPKVSGPS